MNVLVWFTRDLRLADHAPLRQAAEMGRVLPLYIVEPDQWHQPDTSARHWAFTAESLLALREDLAALGAPLIIRMGQAQEVLDRICRQHHIARILSHAETGTLWTRTRDQRLADWARGAGVEWRRLPPGGAEPGQPPAPAAEALLPVPGLEPGPIPSAKALRLNEDRCPHRQPGGRAQGLALLDRFLTHRGEAYDQATQTDERASSRLSPHLAIGTLSVHEVIAATRARQQERPGGQWTRALSRFQTRLASRAPLIERLEAGPDLEHHPLNLAAEALYHGQDASRLAAWHRGETGLPFLDAAMRYLAATGWLNARLRHMVLAVAAHQLWLDWRETGQVLARLSTDYEPGLHWPLVQQAAGMIPEARLRLDNPVSLGRRLDPTGGFTRAWLPELAPVPEAFLQDPWNWPGFRGLAGRRYPEPIVDLKGAERAARLAFASLPRAAPLVRRGGVKPMAGQLQLEL